MVIGKLSAYVLYNMHEAYLQFFLYFPPYLPELQAAVCIHSDPAPVAKHGEGFLEIGPGLPLHIHSNAQRRRPSPGKPDLILKHTHTDTHTIHKIIPEGYCEKCTRRQMTDEAVPFIRRLYLIKSHKRTAWELDSEKDCFFVCLFSSTMNPKKKKKPKDVSVLANTYIYSIQTMFEIR